LNPLQRIGNQLGCQLQHAPNTGAKLRIYQLTKLFNGAACG